MSEKREDEGVLVIWANEKMLDEVEDKLRFVIIAVFQTDGEVKRHVLWYLISLYLANIVEPAALYPFHL